MTSRTPPDIRRLSAFVARVDALSAEEWGRLDAAGARFLARDPLGFAERSVRYAALVGGLTGAGDLLAIPAVAALQAAGWLVGTIADGVRIVLDLPDRRRTTVEDALRRIRSQPSAAATSEEHRAVGDAVRHLAAATLDAAGTGHVASAEPAFTVLSTALAAVIWHERIGAGNAARLYELVEPVIPWASLDDGGATPATS